MTSNALHVALTGFAGLDRAGPGLSVARALRESWPEPLSITALVPHESTPSAWMPGLIDRIAVVRSSRNQRGDLTAHLLSLHDKAPIAAVIAGTNADAASLAKAKSRLEQAGIGTALPDAATVEQLEPLALRNQLGRAGVQMPTVACVANPEYLQQVAETLVYPATLSDDYGSRSVVHSATQMRTVIDTWTSGSLAARLTVQAFVYGDTYVAACLAQSEHPGPMVIARCVGVGQSGQITAATVVSDPDIAEVVEKVVAALHWSGPIEIEVKRCAASSDLIVTDVQCRLPSWCMLSHWSGNNLAAAMLERICGGHTDRKPGRPGTMFVAGVCETAIELGEYLKLRRRQSVALPDVGLIHDRTAKARIAATARDEGLRVAVTGLSASEVINPGIGVARSLRLEDGVSRIVGLGYSGFDAGAYEGGLLDGCFRLDFPDRAQQFASQVLAAHESTPFDVLIPCLDGELPYAIECADELAKHGIATLLPTAAGFEKRAKLKLFGPELERQWGAFSLPDSVIAESEKEALSLALKFGVPAVAKGPLSHCLPVESLSDVTAAWQQLAAMGADRIVLQERLAGPSYAVSVVCDRDHNVVSSLTIKKIALCSRGSTWSAVNVREPDLEQSFARFLKAIEWVGPAEGEFIRDEASDRFFLFEVNPRFTAWISFSSALGHNQPYLAACLARGQHADLAPIDGSRVFVRGCSEIRISPSRLAKFNKRRNLTNESIEAL